MAKEKIKTQDIRDKKYEEILKQWATLISEGDDDGVDKYLQEVILPKIEVGPIGEQKILYQSGPGLMACIFSFFKPGHYEITEHVIKQITDSPTGIKNFARASRLPDLIYFDDLSYHAQNQAAGKSLEDEIAIFVKHLHKQLDRLDKAISEGTLSSIYYYVGILLHAIQDLGAHQGMSNPEHAYLTCHMKSPDADAERYQLAVKLSEEFMSQFLIKRLLPIKRQLDDASSFPWKIFEHPKFKQRVTYWKEVGKFLIYQKAPTDESMNQWWFEWDSKVDKVDDATTQIAKIVFDRL